MSTEAALPCSSTELARAKRQGLRVALAVTFGLSMGLVNGSVLPFLVPLFATQFLLASYSPPGLRQGLEVFGGGLTTFLILFGLGVSPLPGDAPALFATRIAYVLLAILYALCMASLFWPRQHNR